MNPTALAQPFPHTAGAAQRPAQLRRILVVIDPTVHDQPALEKAVRIAERCGSSLELYVCDAEQDVPESWAGGAGAAEYRELRRQRRICELNALAAPLQARGIEVGTMCEWHAPLAQGIGHHVLRTQPDLVVKETHRHASIPRATLSQTDWMLIRQVPSPLLLVRQGRWPRLPRIAAAVDPCHPADRSADLDQQIVDLGCLVTKALEGTLDVFHVLQAPPHLPGDPVPSEQRASGHALARQAVGQLAGKEKFFVHYGEGPVVAQLVRLVNERAANLLLIGAVARPRWIHSAARGTAAQVLERIGCDLLVVKPSGFVSPLLVTDEE